MKAYKLKLVFEDINPPVWRRIILPAGATFNRLHETIQYVTNFQSELYTYHFFGVEIDDYFITNNESILDEYKGKKYAGKTVKQPARIKIDSYLEEHGHLLYNYDFGDNWNIRVELEDTVEDYYFGYPTLLDGEGMAPPEDVGGPPGFDEFVSVYNDPTHPDYLTTYAWAESQSYMPLDITEVNECLKYVKYKKTEWEHVDHENYSVLSDKYRDPDYVDVDALQNKDLVIQYAAACANLYGVIKYPKFLEIYNTQNEQALSSKELRSLLTDSHVVKLLKKKFVFPYRGALVHEAIEYGEEFTVSIEEAIGKPFYIPVKEELLRYVDDDYYEKTIHQEKLAQMLTKDFNISKLTGTDEIDSLIDELQGMDSNFQEVIKGFLVHFEIKDMKQLNEYIHALTMIANTTRIWENRGHTPSELAQMGSQLPSILAPVIDVDKIGRNDPCTCGSGKKYKKCCGK